MSAKKKRNVSANVHPYSADWLHSDSHMLVAGHAKMMEQGGGGGSGGGLSIKRCMEERSVSKLLDFNTHKQSEGLGGVLWVYKIRLK